LKIVHLQAALLRLKVALLRAFQNQTLMSFSNTTKVVFVRTVSHLRAKIALLKHRHCKNFPLLKLKTTLLWAFGNRKAPSLGNSVLLKTEIYPFETRQNSFFVQTVAFLNAKVTF
jgi:hypothetical protein